MSSASATSTAGKASGKAADEPAPVSVKMKWSLLALSLVVIATVIWVAPMLIEKLVLDSELGYVAILMLSIFTPMLVAGIIFSRFAGWSVLGIGDRPLFWAGSGILLGIAGLTITAAYAWLAGTIVPGPQANLDVGLLVAGLALILLQTSSEEVFFRGWVQKMLIGEWGNVAAVSVTALLFMAFHLLGGTRAPVTLLNLLLGGIWFGLLALRSGGLLAPIAAHFAWNAIEELGYGLIPNPGVGSYGAVANWDMAGSALWGGSDDGLNASIGLTIVLISLSLPLLWRRPRSVDVPGQRQPDRAAG